MELDKLRQTQGLDKSLPWGGRSPRLLTQAHIRFSLSQEAATLEEKGDDQFLDEQCRRHLYGS